jgi:ubiquinone/menaquinone biosynthesis C-methylase UbiE
MSTGSFKAYDFDNPSILFKIEDLLKGLIGGPLFYNPFYKTFSLKGGESVLDFGCGGGAGSRCLLKFIGREGRITCIDLSAYWTERAKKRLMIYPNSECISGDIRKMDIPPDSFDVISIIHVIHDILPDRRYVYGLSKTLKPDGWLFNWEPTKESHGMRP